MVSRAPLPRRVRWSYRDAFGARRASSIKLILNETDNNIKKSKGEEEEQQQQLQHTYLSKTFKQQQICFKNFKYYKNKRKKTNKKNSINLKFAEQKQRARRSREKKSKKSDNKKNSELTKRKHLNSKLYNTLHYKNKKHDNAFCKLIRNTFSEADLLKCTTKKNKTNENIILRSNSSFLFPL